VSEINNRRGVVLSNPGVQFIRGLSVAVPVGCAVDFDLYASSQRVPTEWEPQSFRCVADSPTWELQLPRPQNHVHYKLEICGTNAGQVQAGLLLEPVMDDAKVLDTLKSLSIVFTGCARNCEAKLQEGIALAERLGRYFKSSLILVYENDSTDRTRDVLADLAAQGRIQLLTESHLDFHLPFRTQRLSYARNKLLREVRRHEPDLFCVMDLDGINGSDFSESGFLSNFSYFNCWDAVFPANTSLYYDIWAFRNKDLCPADYERRLNTLNPVLGSVTIFDMCLNHLQKIDFTKLNGWLPVDSAFGGMGLYKTNKFQFANYCGTAGDYEACEHVSFHHDATAAGAKLYINPSFLVDSRILTGTGL
jgi:hypothetical protein